MRRAAKTDRNHQDVIDALRALNAQVQSLHMVGGGVPDLLVGIGGRLMLIEVKDGKRSPSERRLTDEQEKWHAAWQGFQIYVITDVSQIREIAEKK